MITTREAVAMAVETVRWKEESQAEETSILMGEAKLFLAEAMTPEVLYELSTHEIR